MLVVITLGVWYYQYILSLCDKFAFFIKLSHYNILSLIYFCETFFVQLFLLMLLNYCITSYVVANENFHINLFIYVWTVLKMQNVEIRLLYIFHLGSFRILAVL